MVVLTTPPRKSSERRIVGVGHHLEFLHRFDVGRETPAAVVARDRRAVQQEQVAALAGAVDLVAVVDVPAARAGEAARRRRSPALKITPGVRAISI